MNHRQCWLQDSKEWEEGSRHSWIEGGGSWGAGVPALELEPEDVDFSFYQLSIAWSIQNLLRVPLSSPVDSSSSLELQVFLQFSHSHRVLHENKFPLVQV